jgi:hypothetical protein
MREQPGNLIRKSCNLQISDKPIFFYILSFISLIIPPLPLFLFDFTFPSHKVYFYQRVILYDEHNP